MSDARAAEGVPGTDTEWAVRAHEVRKVFDNGMVHALDGVELSIRHGDFVALTGPSGCGKSTLLHLIAALDRPTSGTIEVDGRDVSRLKDSAGFRRSHVGLVFQLHNLLPQLTAAQNVEVAMFGTGMPRRARAERARDLLARVDLTGREDRTPPRMSGGERQRVAIARALANHPRLLLADEPTGNLDSEAVRHVVELLNVVRTEQPDLTIVLVTHDPEVAAGADRLVHMRDGRATDAT